MSKSIFSPTDESDSWHLVGQLIVPSGNLLIVDPCYLEDRSLAFERAATAIFTEIGNSELGDDFCFPPEDPLAVAVRLPSSDTRLAVYALLDGTYPSGLPIRGLWIPFGPDLGRVVIDIDNDHWYELGSFSVDGGRVALFDSGLAGADWQGVNKQIDEVIRQEMYRFAQMIEAQTETSDSGEWPAEDAEQPALGQNALESHAFELAVETQSIIVSSTGHGDGLYQAYVYLPKGRGAPGQPRGLWIDFGFMSKEPIAQNLSDEQQDILTQMRACLPESAGDGPGDLSGLGAGALFQRIAHLLWLGRLKQVPLPLPDSLVDAALRAAVREKYLASKALSNPMIGEGRVAKLAGSALGWERACAARNPLTTPADLGHLATDREPGIVILVAENPATPADALRMLAASRDHDIRAAVASNPATPADTVAKLARDRKFLVRSAVTRRADLAPELVREMIGNDPSPYIRADLLRRNSLPEEEAAKAIRDLARMLHADEIDHFTDLLDRIEPGDLAPSDTDAPALRYLAESRGPMIRSDFERIEQEGDFECRAAIAVHPDCPADILARMAAGDDKRLWQLVATNPSTPAESLARLAEAGDNRTLLEALDNPSLPREALIELLRSEDSWFADMAAAHPNLIFDEAFVCLRDAGRPIPRGLLSRPDCPPGFISELTRSTNPAERLLVAEHDSTPPELLTALAADPDPEIRKAVAENRETPAETLAAMLHDTDSDVVMGAATSGRLDPSLVAGICEGSGSVLTTSQCVELLPKGTPISAGRIRALASDAKSWELATIAKSAATPPDLLELLALVVRIDDEGEEGNFEIVNGEGASRLGDMLSKLIAAASMM